MSACTPSSRGGLGLTFGVLLAAVSGPACAVGEPLVETFADTPFELIAADRAAELPLELRATTTPPSHAEALGLRQDGSSHQVQVRWIVREHIDLAGYRVTLAAADGLPGNLAARWWVAATTGVALGNGLTAYSTAVSLTLDEPAPVAAAIEAIDRDGHPLLLAVRRSVAKPESDARRLRATARESVAADPGVFQISRSLPSPGAAPTSTVAYPWLRAGRVSTPAAPRTLGHEPSDAIWSRGPPPVLVAT